jgi:hypothetical protein
VLHKGATQGFTGPANNSHVLPGFPDIFGRVAEREGLPRRASNANKINDLTFARLTRVYQCCALKSSADRRSQLNHASSPSAPPYWACSSKHSFAVV